MLLLQMSISDFYMLKCLWKRHFTLRGWHLLGYWCVFHDLNCYFLPRVAGVLDPIPARTGWEAGYSVERSTSQLNLNGWLSLKRPLGGSRLSTSLSTGAFDDVLRGWKITLDSCAPGIRFIRSVLLTVPIKFHWWGCQTHCNPGSWA